MRFTSLPKWIGAGVITASLAIAPLTFPAQAQQNTAPGTTTQPGTQVQTRDTDDGFDWGWLGLLGLLGLAGLAGNKRREPINRVDNEPVNYTAGTGYVNNDPNVGVRSGTDYNR